MISTVALMIQLAACVCPDSLSLVRTNLPAANPGNEEHDCVETSTVSSRLEDKEALYLSQGFMWRQDDPFNGDRDFLWRYLERQGSLEYLYNESLSEGGRHRCVVVSTPQSRLSQLATHLKPYLQCGDENSDRYALVTKPIFADVSLDLNWHGRFCTLNLPSDIRHLTAKGKKVWGILQRHLADAFGRCPQKLCR